MLLVNGQDFEAVWKALSVGRRQSRRDPLRLLRDSSSPSQVCFSPSILTMADLEDGPAQGEVPPPKKKSLFAKPAWAKEPQEQKAGIDFFSRADELWPGRFHEDQKKSQKKQIRLEKRPTTSAERKSSRTPDGKRRRMTPKEGTRGHSSEGSLNHDDPNESLWKLRQVSSIAVDGHILTASRGSTLSTPGSQNSLSNSSRPKPQASLASLAERRSRDIHAQKEEGLRNEVRSKGCISLSDGENEAGGVGQGFSNGAAITLDDDDDRLAIAPKSIISIEDDPDMSDEEFAELAKEARAHEKQRALDHLNAGQSFETKSHDSNESNIPVHATDDIFEDRSVTSEDPIIEIFVSSWIEGTNPLRVQRKLSQKLREVRLIWCDKQMISGQPLAKSVKDSIFLTWRGKKLFDMTNCKSLGLKLDGNGCLFSEGEGFMDGKVHFEAWTPDLYEEHQRKLSAKQDRGDSEDDLMEVVEHPVQKIKLIMKAKDMEPLKLQVKPTTTFHKMATAFRDSRDIPEGKDIAFYFDGDKLDPESRVEDTELADMDNVEVHIR